MGCLLVVVSIAIAVLIIYLASKPPKKERHSIVEGYWKCYPVSNTQQCFDLPFDDGMRDCRNKTL